ncbi:MAG: YiiX/YebB-like N1pC/P60 family cysteine hydrolase [Bacteroidota bacterium]
MNKTIYFCLLILCFSCKSPKQEAASTQALTKLSFDYSNFELKPGDILFQDSDCGPFCESIEKVTFGIQGSKFSHVGMIIPKGKDELTVIEAITAGVVETPLDSFFMRSFDEEHKSKVVVGRLKKDYAHLIPKAIAFAQTKLGLAYDDVFDISNDKYYCSELIYDSFKHANEDQPIFQLQAMTYKDPETNSTFPIWEKYFQELNVPIPEGEPGLNPGGMSTSDYIDILHFYGKPQGYVERAGVSN